MKKSGAHISLKSKKKTSKQLVPDEYCDGNRVKPSQDREPRGETQREKVSSPSLEMYVMENS